MLLTRRNFESGTLACLTCSWKVLFCAVWWRFVSQLLCFSRGLILRKSCASMMSFAETTTIWLLQVLTFAWTRLKRIRICIFCSENQELPSFSKVVACILLAYSFTFLSPRFEADFGRTSRAVQQSDLRFAPSASSWIQSNWLFKTWTCAHDRSRAILRFSNFDRLWFKSARFTDSGPHLVVGDSARWRIDILERERSQVEDLRSVVVSQ